MNPSANGASRGAPPRPNGVTATAPAAPVRKVVKPAPSIFKKVNNKHKPAGTKATATIEVPTRIHTNKSMREQSPATGPVQTVSGFSDPRVFSENLPFTDYKLVTTKRDLLQGLRYHLVHFPEDQHPPKESKEPKEPKEPPLDIRNDKAFPRPVHLHRRDPRIVQPEPVTEEIAEPKDGLTAAQREEVMKAKDLRQKQKEENMAQIAPNLSTVKKVANKKKTAQHYTSKLTEEQKRTIQNNYEERLPWHLEDWTGNKVFVGHPQIGPSRMYAALTFDESSRRYRMIPVEKVYNFEAKQKNVVRREGTATTTEEAEALMKRKLIMPEVLSRVEEKRVREAQISREAKQSSGLYTGGHKSIYASRDGEDADFDFDEDFADDEEGDQFLEKDEDEKAAEKKVKEDHLQANFLDFKNVEDYDVLEEREKREAEAEKNDFKKIRKALAKREGNYNQGSDTDDDSSTDSEDERQKLEADKLANGKKEEDGVDGKASRLPSGANTPSGRREKHGHASDREKKPRPKKRPGSPNLSDASGTDASVARKKKKTKHPSSSHPTPGPSRPRSPDNANLDPSSARNRSIGRTASYTSVTAGSDNEAGAMSDGTRQKIMLKVKKAASPPTSRPSSPPPPSAAKTITTAEEVRALVPPEGITPKQFMTLAGLRNDKEAFKAMMPLIRKVATLNKETGLLRLKVFDGQEQGETKNERSPAPAVKKEE